MTAEFYNNEFIGILKAAVGSSTWQLVEGSDGVDRPCVVTREVFTDSADNLIQQLVFVTSGTYANLLESGTAINVAGRCNNMLVGPNISDAEYEFKCVLEPGEVTL